MKRFRGFFCLLLAALLLSGLAVPANGAAESTQADALLEWWNGDWYGWWTVSGTDGYYTSWRNRRWDCCAHIRIGEDFTGSVTVWDGDLPRSNAVSEVTVTLNSAGTGEHGTLISEEGYFMDGVLAHADWIVDPGLIQYDARMNYDDMICIDGWYEDSDGSFKYNIYLRPWGMSWDDVATENRPDTYDAWYLPLVEAGRSAPDTVGGAVDLAAGEPQETTEAPQETTGEPQDSAVADEDWGKSNPSATGIAELEAMQALYKKCYEGRSDALHLFSYEDAREMLGCDGVVWKKSNISWNDTKHTYRWVTADGADYFNISFSLENGEEWYFSCNFSDNVKNNLW